MLVIGATLHDVAVDWPALIIVAKAVAGVPTCTERLEGRIEDTRRVSSGISTGEILMMKASVRPLSWGWIAPWVGVGKPPKVSPTTSILPCASTVTPLRN